MVTYAQFAQYLNNNDNGIFYQLTNTMYLPQPNTITAIIGYLSLKNNIKIKSNMQHMSTLYSSNYASTTDFIKHFAYSAVTDTSQTIHIKTFVYNRGITTFAKQCKTKLNGLRVLPIEAVCTTDRYHAPIILYDKQHPNVIVHLTGHTPNPKEYGKFLKLALSFLISQDILLLATVPTIIKDYLNNKVDGTAVINYILQDEVIIQAVTPNRKGILEKLYNLTIEQRNKTVQNKISSIKNTIQRYEDQLTNYYNDLLTQQKLITKSTPITKQFPIFEKSKEIINANVVSSKCYLSICTPMTFKTEAVTTTNFKHFINDQPPKVKDILTKLFITQELQLLLKADIVWDLNTGSIVYNNYTTQYIDQTINTLYNPHLRYHGCFGSNRNVINKALVNFDIDVACAATIAAVSNINIYDGMVIDEFKTDLKSALKLYTKPILLKDPTTEKVYTLKEYEEAIKNGTDNQSNTEA